MKNKAWKRMAVMVMCLLMLVMIVPIQSAEAATNVGKNIRGNSSAAKSFYVKTGGKKGQFKLEQAKGIMSVLQAQYRNNGAHYSIPYTSNKPNGTKKMYELYIVRVEKLNNKNSVIKTEEYKLKEKSLPIKLDKNSTYKITLTPTFVDFDKKMRNSTQYFYAHYDKNPYSKVQGFGSAYRMFIDWRNYWDYWKPLGWKCHNQWYIVSTSNISKCYY